MGSDMPLAGLISLLVVLLLLSAFFSGSETALMSLNRYHLRHKVRVQTDGGLKTGLDVVKAAILGAESFGFGTGPMVALGCKYLRICHLNNCATGVATQDKELRENYYKGTVETAKNFFLFMAEETREWMARLGVRTMEELVGRVDLLEIFEGIFNFFRCQGYNV